LLGGEAIPPADAPPNEKGALPAVVPAVLLAAPNEKTPDGFVWFWVADTALAKRLPPKGGWGAAAGVLAPNAKGLL